MRLDKFSNPIFTDNDLFDALYRGAKIPFSEIIVEGSKDISKLEEIAGAQIQQVDSKLELIEVGDYDQALQSDWFMPEEYKTLDIESWVLDQCDGTAQLTRAAEELVEFRDRNMLDLLRWLKYFVDTMRANNLVWGVGRGSSVASYVLYKIGVHKVDSMKYNLDWQEFLR